MKDPKVNLPVLVESTAYALACAQIRASRRAELARNPYILDDLSLEESLNTGSLSSFLYEAEDAKKSLFDNEDAKNIEKALASIDSTIEEVRGAVEGAASGKMAKTLGAIDGMRGELKDVGKLDWMKLAYGGQDALQDKLLKVNNTTADILAAIGMVADALVESGELMANAGIPEQFHEQTIQALADLHEEHGGIPTGGEAAAAPAGGVDEQEEPAAADAPPAAGGDAAPTADAGGDKIKFSTPDEIRKFVSKKFEVPGWFSQAWSSGLEAASDEAGDFMKKTGSLLKGVFGKKEKPKIPPEGFADDYMELTLAEALALAEVAAPWKELVTASSDTAGEAGAEALAGAQTVPTGGLPQGGGGGEGGGGGQGGGGGGGGALPPGTERPTTRPGGGGGGKDIATFEDLMNRATAPATQKKSIDFATIMGNLINKDPKSKIEFVDELPKEEEAPKEEAAPEGEPVPDNARPRATEGWVHNRSLTQWLFETPNPQPNRSLLAEAIFYKDFEDELRKQGISDEEMGDVAAELADRLDNEYDIQVKGIPEKGGGGGEQVATAIPPEVWEMMRAKDAQIQQQIQNSQDLSEKDRELALQMAREDNETRRAEIAAGLENSKAAMDAIVTAGSFIIEEEEEEIDEKTVEKMDRAAAEAGVVKKVTITSKSKTRYEAVISAMEEKGDEPGVKPPPEGEITNTEREKWMSALRKAEKKAGIREEIPSKAKAKAKKKAKAEPEAATEAESASGAESGTSSEEKSTEKKAKKRKRTIKSGKAATTGEGFIRRGATLAEALFDDDTLLSDNEIDDLHLIRWSRISGLPEDQVIETTGTSKLLIERREERHEEWTDDDLVKLGWLRMAGLHTGEDYE